MKRFIKIGALMLALLNVLLLFGSCSQGSDPTTPPVSTAPSSAPATQEPAEDSGPAYPRLVEEDTTLTIWQTFSASYITTMNDSLFTKELAKRTGVLLEFHEASSADATTVYNPKSWITCTQIKKSMNFSSSQL